MLTRLIRIAPFAATLAVAALSAPAHAGVSWSVGINAPIAPGVHVGTVIGNGHARYYAPAPVVYAPPPVYVAPPVVYAPPPPVYVAPRPVYVAPVVYAPRRVYYRAPVVIHRPYPPVQNWHPTRPGGHVNWPQGGGNPGHGPYRPTAAQAR